MLGHGVSERTGKVCGVAITAEDDDIMMITVGGTVIRTPANGIPTYSRTASGVIVMRTGDDTICNVTLVKQKEEEAAEAAEE